MEEVYLTSSQSTYWRKTKLHTFAERYVLFKFFFFLMLYISRSLLTLIFYYQILKGLAKMHRQDRVHRDIKSDNILLSKDGDVKLGKYQIVYNLQYNF